MITDQTKLRARALADCAPELVAAAPDLLAALQAILAPNTNDSGAWYSEARSMGFAAIAKARGQS
jgi:hypothetical protein